MVVLRRPATYLQYPVQRKQAVAVCWRAVVPAADEDTVALRLEAQLPDCPVGSLQLRTTPVHQPAGQHSTAQHSTRASSMHNKRGSTMRNRVVDVT